MKKHKLNTGIGRMIEIEGKDYLYFSGTSYLGIPQDIDFLDILANNVFEYGSNFGQSRKNNIQLEVFDEFETFFAQEAGADAGALFSSGYLAGIAAWKSVINQVDEVWIAPDAHPAVIPDGHLASDQLNFKQWKIDCLEKAESLSSRSILIIGNAVDALNVQIHDYSWVEEIGKKYKVWLLVDDSHAFGVLGNGIFGTYSKMQYDSVSVIVSGSLGKGLGLPAGIVLCPDYHIDHIKNLPLFAGASPGSPAHIRTFLEMQHTYEAAHEHLKELCQYFYELIAFMPQIVGNPDYPVFRYTEDSWVEQLEKSGIITSSFPYPHADSPKVNRIVLSAFHEKEDIEYLADILENLAL
ncbi:aminotransferase class I/II-fold pyridoxal phosphate-dependent enzyme [Algoriphagus marincola]|uniref:Aminotransferase class I/II-fold pyridoxal phosphate-dependent enzyme n=1 Tax=Algoriphagus marincola TaxID=264027 RepID=A0ABS7N6T5_9BACT|nr:aminotransferase class I/II-fold pyridoxal phosphate-dependent enzyme [Algoriphagus marincola]MBY5951681.1 aminotransferase class I/II-fold pyridoxal phosphate-dependent enzyme [Algoriphagus marincola]